MEYTQNEMLRQIFDEHWQEFCDYWAAKTRDASQIETVSFDQERHTGVLMRLEWQGLKKIVVVTPQDLLAGLAQLNEELRQMRESEMWQAGVTVRKLRPENN